MRKKDDELKRKIEELKASSAKKEFPIYKAICVEEYDAIRNKLRGKLNEVGNSHYGFKIEFSLLRYNSQIAAEIIKNCGIDLVIVDLDQYPNDPVDITNQIRAFSWHIPIIFASVDSIKAGKALNTIFASDQKYSQSNHELINFGTFQSKLIRIGKYLISSESLNNQTSINKILFPLLNNLIYRAEDKHHLYLSAASRIISSSILRARELKKHIEQIINEKKNKENNDNRNDSQK